MELTEIVLFEGAKWAPAFSYKVRGVYQDITGYAFVARFLDKRGGAILLEVIPTIEDAAAGTLRINVTKDQVDAFRTNRTIPAWFELYVTIQPGDDPLKWIDLPVKYRVGGRPA